MTLTGDLHRLAREYKADPSGQYYRNLEKMLNLYSTGKTSKEEVLAYVQRWAAKP